MYWHECEPVNPMLIMLPMMQYGALCLFGRWALELVTLDIIFYVVAGKGKIKGR